MIFIDVSFCVYISCIVMHTSLCRFRHLRVSLFPASARRPHQRSVVSCAREQPREMRVQQNGVFPRARTDPVERTPGQRYNKIQYNIVVHDNTIVVQDNTMVQENMHFAFSWAHLNPSHVIAEPSFRNLGFGNMIILCPPFRWR